MPESNRVKQGYHLIFLMGLLAVTLTNAVGDTLDDFEHASTTPRKSTSTTTSQCSNGYCGESQSSNHDQRSYAFGDGVFNLIIDGIEEMLTYGTHVTLARSGGDYEMPQIIQRQTGSPLLPTFRLSAAWQSIDPNLEGRDFSLELGYSLFGAEFRRTVYIESNPRDQMSLNYTTFMYRLSYGNSFQMNPGLGRLALSGNQVTTGNTIAIPMIWQFSGNHALKLWQAYSSINNVSLSDVDLSMMYFRNGYSAAIGYRVVSNPASELSGPYLGLSCIY